MNTILKNDTKVILANVRLSYPHIFKPYSFNGQDEKYSASLLIGKEDTESIEIIEKAIENAITVGKDKFGKKFKANKLPLRDGDDERPGDEAYEGHYFLNANSTRKPTVVGKYKDKETGKAIRLDEEDVYAGCYVNASINFYPFSVSGNSGVAVGLGNIQKTKDGERLGGASTAEEDFDNFENIDYDEELIEVIL